MWSRLLVTLFVVLLTACGSGGRYTDYDDAAEMDVAAYDATEAVDEARQAVYEEHGADSDGTGADTSNVNAYDVEDIGNYVCTVDCSGHEAGFTWAQENDVTDTSECGGNSMSFTEGCEAFAEERQEQADLEAQEAAELAAEERVAEIEADVEYEDDY